MEIMRALGRESYETPLGARSFQPAYHQV